jgi:hypothetical protein
LSTDLHRLANAKAAAGMCISQIAEDPSTFLKEKQTSLEGII